MIFGFRVVTKHISRYESSHYKHQLVVVAALTSRDVECHTLTKLNHKMVHQMQWMPKKAWNTIE